MAGLFDTFTISKRGLNVQQNNIDVNAHNIANVNTPGYSRQRAVIETTRPFGGTSKYHIGTAGQIGTGAQVTQIMRIRDKFIDYQLRQEYGRLGNYQVQSDFLSEVVDTFGEPSENAIQNLLSEFFNQFQEAVKSPTTAKKNPIQAADSLANALNQVYTSLEAKINNAQDLLKQNVVDVNSYLNQINELNKEINMVTAVGQTPNDLMDKRDYLIDQVSEQFGIKVTEKERNTIDLSIQDFPAPGQNINNLVNANPANENYTRFSYVNGVKVEEINNGNITKITVEYYPLGDSTKTPETITVSGTDLKDLKESLEQNRILIADENGKVSANSEQSLEEAIFKIYEKDNNNNVDEKAVRGEIAGNQSVQKMVKNYMDQLDKIAKVLAYSINAIQTGKTGDADIDDANIASNPNLSTSDILFFVAGDNTSDDNISAKNIRVNEALLNDSTLLNNKGTTLSGESDFSRIQAMADLNTICMNIANIDINNLNTRGDFFKKDPASGVAVFGVSFDGIKLEGNSTGKTIDTFYKNMVTELGSKAQEAKRITTKQQENTIANLEQQKASVSGVSLDEEMTDLIQFQHAYQANAKMINTIDQLLDVVINQLKA